MAKGEASADKTFRAVKRREDLKDGGNEFNFRPAWRDGWNVMMLVGGRNANYHNICQTR